MSILSRPLYALGPGLLLVLLILLPRAGRAQVLDDSTKIVYGPRTTRVIHEPELLRDSTRGAIIDTSLTRWPQERFWFHDTTFQQDLGNVGTASRPLLYQPNLQLGARFGRNAFDKYVRDLSRIPYYDSRSPYSFFRYVQSNVGEQVFEISYTRSLRENFSVGIAYERFAANTVLGASTSQSLTEQNNVLLFTRYQTPDERYHLLAAISTNRHTAVEQGGIQPRATEPEPGDLFKYERQQVYLTTAANTDDRDQLHLAHTYRLLGRGLTAFHVLDLRRQYNSYFDTQLGRLSVPAGTAGSLIFYPATLRNVSATLDRAEYRQAENTVGVLGRTPAVEYRLYARRRDYRLVSSTLLPTATGAAPVLGTAAPTRRGGEVFLGGTAAFRYRRIFAIETAGEYKLFDEYWLRARARTGPLSAELLRTSYAPTLTQQEFVGNHYEWHNDFRNTTADHLTVALQQRLPGADHHFEASGSVVNISRLVFYNNYGVPEQLSDSKQLLIATARHQVRIGHVAFDNQATYTKGGEGAGLRIPALVTNSRVVYQNYLFRHALFGQVGAEVYYQSRFRGYDYSPSTQQFFIQDRFTIRNYAVANAFVSADIGSAAIFLKVAYLNEGLGADGYFVTPYYTALPRRFQFGVRWQFFD